MRTLQTLGSAAAVTGTLLLFVAASRADTVVLQPAADTTLIATAADNNLGGADFFNAGTTGGGNPNRGLIFYDLSSAVPANATITSVELSLSIVRQPEGTLRHSLFSLRRMYTSWGEGAQTHDGNSPGLGLEAGSGEATWNHRFAGGASWSQPGGQEGVDFSTALSSTALIGSLGEDIFFTSSPELVADIQHWLDNPSVNFGWMLLTESEDINKTARSFASRESGFGPSLTVNYVTGPEPSVLSLAGLFLLGLGLLARRRGPSSGDRGSR